MCCSFTHSIGQCPPCRYGFLAAKVVGRNESCTGSIMAVSPVRSILGRSEHSRLTDVESNVCTLARMVIGAVKRKGFYSRGKYEVEAY